jgi:DNA-binding MarR family transcriptional regulator
MPSEKVAKAFQLWILLHQARDAVYNARNKDLLQYGISPEEAEILRALSCLGATATPAKLARWVYRKQNTVAGILDRMQRKGLLTLRKDTKIKNLVRISLTEEGKTAYKAVNKRQLIYHIFKVIPEDKYDEFETCLTGIRDAALKKTGESIQQTP